MGYQGIVFYLERDDGIGREMFSKKIPQYQVRQYQALH